MSDPRRCRAERVKPVREFHAGRNPSLYNVFQTRQIYPLFFPIPVHRLCLACTWPEYGGTTDNAILISLVCISERRFGKFS
jgi:hypothetical protein